MAAADLLSLTLRNFQSYGNNTTTVNLNFNCAALISGRNLDSMVDGQIDSNGSGKSTLLAAIIYVLYEQTLDSDIKINDLINKINGKNLNVTLDLRKDGRYYKIDRYRKLDKEGSGVYLLRKDSADDDWDYKKHDVTQAGNINVEDEIIKLIGFPFEIFIRILAITASSKPFLKLELSKQREITEELFGFTELSEKAEKLKEILKANNVTIDTLDKLDEQIKGEIERHNNQLLAIKQKVEVWNEQHADKLKNLKKQIRNDEDEYGNVDFTLEENKFEEIRIIREVVNTLTNEIALKRKELTGIQKQLKDSKNWNEVNIHELAQLQKEIDSPLKFKTIEETQEFEKALMEFDSGVNEFDKIISDLDKRMAEKTGTINVLRSEIKLIDQQIKSKEDKVKDVDHELIHLQDSKCPYCSQPYVESKDKLFKTTDTLDVLRKEINTLLTNRKDKNVRITARETELTELIEEQNKQKELKKSAVKEKQLFVVEILGSDVVNLKHEYEKTLNREKLINKLQSKERESNPFLKEISLDELNIAENDINRELGLLEDKMGTQVNSQCDISATLKFKRLTDIAPLKMQLAYRRDELVNLENEINPFIESYETLNTTILSKRKTEEIQKLQDTVKHDEFLLKLLTKKDSFIRKALINRYIPFLNERIKYYLSKLGLPHKVHFKQDMTVGITQFKSEISFASLSSGQKARVNIALNFSFRDVLQSRYGTINFCILDEILDVGLGSTGVQLAVKMIKSWIKDNNLSCLIISHRDEIASNFENRVVVELKNGFSNIVESNI